MKRLRTGGWLYLFYGIAALFLVMFLAVPIFRLMRESVAIFSSSNEPLPDGFFLYLLKVTFNTFRLAFLTTAVSLAVSVPLAFLIVKFKVSRPGLWIGLLTIPLITPAFISSFATIILFGNSGVLSMALGQLGIKLPPIYGLTGLVITQVLHTVPYSLILIITGLKTVPRYLEESAHSMGTSILGTQLKIVLPYILPHVIMAGLMVFLTSMGDVGGPLIIGGSYKVISVEIYSNFVSFMGDERIPLIFSTWVILLAFILLFGVNKVMKMTEASHKFRLGIMEYDVPSARKIGTAVVAVLTSIFMLPYLAILIHSFGTIWAYDWLPAAFTLKNYNDVVNAGGPIRNTLILISTVTPMIIFLGIILGYMFKNQRNLRFLSYLTLLPFVIPGVVIGVGLIQTYSRVRIFGHDLMGSVIILIIAIGVRRLPFVLKTIEAGFAKIDPSQREAALSLGSGDIGAFTSVIFPQIRPAVYSAVVIGIVKVVTELSASLIIYPPAWQNMSLYIAYFVNEGFISRASAMGVILILIVGACTAVSRNLSRKDELNV